MLSMTGYGTGLAELGSGKLVIEAKGVNHRFLEVVVRFPEEVVGYSSIAESVARKLLERGRIDITAKLEHATGGALTLQIDRAEAAFQALRELRDRLCPDQPIPLSLLGAIPGLFSVQGSPNSEQVRSAVQIATKQACLALIEMRRREGELLSVDLKQRIESVRKNVEAIRAYFPNLVEGLRRKLYARIERIVADTAVALNQNRLEQEVALLADRADVSEELTRMVSHCDQFESLISPTAKQIGRKMEFLLQEMGREVNTIGSKMSEIEVIKVVLEIKADLERMREQVQNVL